MTDLKSFGESIVHNLEQVIVGKYQSVELVVIGLLCQGHVLIEDVPGVGKTMLARSLAKSLDCTFNRIQFTPDMLPSDVTGVSIFNQEKRTFEFRPGPIMGQIVLADEVSPDNCRLWDSKTGEKMDKDRFRRDLGKVEEGYQEVARRLGILPEAGVRDLKGPEIMQ